MKFVLFRNNDVYERHLTPAIEARQDLKLQVFPAGTPEEEIRSWVQSNGDAFADVEEVISDRTTRQAVAGLLERLKDADGQMFLQLFGRRCATSTIDTQLYEATQKAMEKTDGNGVIDIVLLMLAREVPDEIIVVKRHMGDHNLFNQGYDPNMGRDTCDTRDAEMLRGRLEAVTGKPVTVIENLPEVSSDTTWVFYDRHCKSRIEGFENPPRWFRVPTENLVVDATTFGVSIDIDEIFQRYREMVASW